MIPRRVLTFLLSAGCVLPVAIVIVSGVARLLGAMGDSGGSLALDRTALGLGILWAIGLVCLLLAVAIEILSSRER